MKSLQTLDIKNVLTNGSQYSSFYPPAIACANLILGTKFSHDIIIGLKDEHPRRTFKNIIERLRSTFHASYKTHHGLKDFEATIAHTVLFFFLSISITPWECHFSYLFTKNP